MAELTTKKVSDVAMEVKRLFGDEDAVQISDADIIRWINAAQRKIVAVNPILQRTSTKDVTAGVGQYTYPADRIQYIQSISFNGLPLEGYSYAEAQEYIMKNNGSTTTGAAPLIWWQWAQTLNFWPIPDADATAALKMDYVAIPSDVDGVNDLLSVPDRYMDAVIEFVMQKAHLLDENYDAANYTRSQFTDSLGQLSEQENRIRISTYPTMTVREEDL